jgi:hypothetical protein
MQDLKPDKNRIANIEIKLDDIKGDPDKIDLGFVVSHRKIYPPDDTREDVEAMRIRYLVIVEGQGRQRRPFEVSRKEKFVYNFCYGFNNIYDTLIEKGYFQLHGNFIFPDRILEEMGLKDAKGENYSKVRISIKHEGKISIIERTLLNG